MAKKLAVCLPVVAAVFALDQWLKWWTTENIRGAANREILFIRLIYVENRGAAFSLFQNMRWLFVTLGIVVITAIVIIVIKERIQSPMALAGASLIIAGTLGNLWDRAVNGYVVDMFELTFIKFAIFNVADLALTCGGILTCLYILRLSRKPV